jgi:esterase/lipase superfamily enzyme
MFTKPHMVPSQHLGRKLYLWQYGDFGRPVLVFPSASGMAHEWENKAMIEQVAPLVNSGKIKLYCVESNVSEAWTKKDGDPAWRLGRHIAYERFVYDELAPFIQADCRSKDIPLACTGTSLGAFYALNAVLKRPDIFHYALCLSGRYEMSAFNPIRSSDMYFQNPLAYLPGLSGEVLDKIKANVHVDLVCGRGPWEDGNWQETQAVARHLDRLGVSNRLDLWGKDCDHDWPWWRKQVKMYFQYRFG